MPAKERVAYFKSMDRQERRGLWLQLKKEQKARQGISRKAGAYQNPFPVTEQPAGWYTRAVGDIAYDAGFPSMGFGGGAKVGNRFNTHTAIPVLASGTVNTVRAVMVRGPAFTATSSNATAFIFGPQTTMGGATALFTTVTTAVGVIDSLSFTGLNVNYTGSSFFVLFQDNSQSYIPVFGTETRMGQGHHGLVGYTGGMGITGTFNLGGNLNAFIRATGNIVPVELMNFTVE